MNYSTSVWFSRRGGLFLVLLLYAAATLPALSRYPAPWVDEGWIGEVAAQIARGQAPGNPSHGTLYRFNDRIYWMPPLYFFLLGGWFSLTGIALIAGRYFNAAAGAVTVALLYRLTGRRWGPVPGIVAGLVFCLDTFVWKAHRTIRFESVMALLAVLLASVVDGSARAAGSPGGVPARGRPSSGPPAGGASSGGLPPGGASSAGISAGRMIATGVVAGLLLNVHPLGALFAAAAAVELLRRNRLSFLRTRWPWMALAAFLLTILPYALYCYADRTAGFANFLGQNSYHVEAGGGMPAWLREGARYAAFFPFPWRIPAAAGMAAVLVLAWRRRRDPTVALAFTFLGVPLLGMLLLPNKTLLYFVPAMPFMAVLAAAAWAAARPIPRAAVLLLLVSGLAVDAGLLWRSRACHPVEALAAIRSNLRPEDRVAGTFVTWWAAQPRPFHEFSRGATLEAVAAFGPQVILLGDRQWEQEKTGRFAPLDRALHERFDALGIAPTIVADPCLGSVRLYRVGTALPGGTETGAVERPQSRTVPTAVDPLR